MKLTFTHILHKDTVSYDIDNLTVLSLRTCSDKAMRVIAKQTNIRINPANVAVTFNIPNQKLARAEKEMDGD